ncbi:hypothetical protein CCACVL1_06169 [Corchorus capsularis]|uniref:Uncharacterized protein n=1 Tax=Corchorus capsularis TaxID=210143 RepID=A0A1R3JGZ8_COCAP|nr:hypothetical protein CCACVL1_06169 [Corchorus capsularis]
MDAGDCMTRALTQGLGHAHRRRGCMSCALTRGPTVLYLGDGTKSCE